MANILFRDGSAVAFHNVDNALSIKESVFSDWAELPAALDQLMVNADYAYRGLPQHAPQIVAGEPDECKGLE
jgi:hypothetical protein